MTLLRSDFPTALVLSVYLTEANFLELMHAEGDGYRGGIIFTHDTNFDTRFTRCMNAHRIGVYTIPPTIPEFCILKFVDIPYDFAYTDDVDPFDLMVQHQIVVLNYIAENQTLSPMNF